ncbi:MAG: mannose-1-phosphate guanylyltransferase [Candidatus Sabulitectum sp.]|nr:mannose-1-phosphate guanylyltransferase [Candidatus Sabulitectum sp.]
MDSRDLKMNNKRIFAVIMAGGRGTRFWPASTKARPKQFMDLLGGGTMLQKTAARFANISGSEGVLVVTGAIHSAIAADQLPFLPKNNLLLEPVGRNTAACIGWAAETLRRRGFGESVMIVAASDHRIEPVSGFEETMRNAVALAEEGYLCTIGITPDHPATGYGYLQTGKEINSGNLVKSFKEKPDAATAELYLESGDYLWNSGMFIWRVDSFLEEFQKHMPGLYRDIQQLPDTTAPSMEEYSVLESQSIDYGVMEKTDRAVVVPALFKWSDIGDWPGARGAGVERGRSLKINSENTLVFDETGRLTVMVGLDNVSVVSTEKAILVMSDSGSQKIKEVVASLEEAWPDLV